MKGRKHWSNAVQKQQSLSVRDFFAASTSRDQTSRSLSDSVSSLLVVAPGTVVSHLCFATTAALDVLGAEIFWCLNAVTKHHLFKSMNFIFYGFGMHNNLERHLEKVLNFVLVCRGLWLQTRVTLHLQELLTLWWHIWQDSWNNMSPVCSSNCVMVVSMGLPSVVVKDCLYNRIVQKNKGWLCSSVIHEGQIAVGSSLYVSGTQCVTWQKTFLWCLLLHSWHTSYEVSVERACTLILSAFVS